MNKVFHLKTKHLSYVFHVNNAHQLVHDYFGNQIKLINDDITPLTIKSAYAKGDSTIYQPKEDEAFTMSNVPLEFSFPLKGDYKETMLVLKNKKRGYVFDFVYDSYRLNKSIKPLKDLPSPHDLDEELIIYLKERKLKITVELHYLTSFDNDVIIRNVVIKNSEKENLEVLKCASLQLDTFNHNFELLSLNGGWASESHAQFQTIKRGIIKIDAKTGSSSSIHNPFIMIRNRKEAYLFNLIYSGDHEETIELTSYDLLRVTTGVSSYLFNYILKPGESFTSPYAIMTYSNEGSNVASLRMHHFINECVVNKNFRYQDRPMLINNWEGTYFKFNESKLMKIAKAGADFNLELFVLDDGWFSTRNSDTEGLGDYDVNKKKLPHGLSGLAKKINKLGMKFGLWMEPEAVNPKSKLYDKHPEWAIHTEGVTPSEGRHELLLDLTKKEVQDYLITNISNILESANISYIKWDMNRNMSDNALGGAFVYNYYIGLYRVMKTLTSKFPHVLFEGCSSGGNRFDLGIATYFPQIWASDCTDPYERLFIQSGLYYGYPQSMVSAHVSHHISHQSLRNTNYHTKFNVASFGAFGYELMLNELSKLEKEEIKAQIKFYKLHRHLFQFGDLYQLKTPKYHGDNAIWMVKKGNEAIVGVFNGLQSLTPKETIIHNLGLDEKKIYRIETFRQDHDLKMFGNLINMVIPVHLNSEGKIVNLIAKHQRMKAEKEIYEVNGSILNNGLILYSEWAGNGYNEKVRLMADFGSRLYYIKAKK